MADSRDALLHPGRLARCTAAMREHGLDAMLLSRAADVRYASGARRIYSSGTRPFAPSCLVTSAGEVHVLGIGDAGVPSHVPEANRHRARWHSAEVAATVARILVDRRLRIGVDGMSVSQRAVLGTALPAATWADADVVMRSARSVKTVAELEVLADAERRADSVCAGLVGEFESGMTERGLRARAAAAVVGAGAVLGAAPLVEARDGALRAEVALLVDGYAGEALVVRPAHRVAVAEAPLARLLGRLRPGVSCASLVAAGDVEARIHGLGLGVETPLVAPRWAAGGSADELAAGMVLRVRVAAGGGVAAATVVVEESGGVALRERAPGSGRPVARA